MTDKLLNPTLLLVIHLYRGKKHKQVMFIGTANIGIVAGDADAKSSI